MWIESLYLDGFGLFCQERVDGLPEGLVVFFGRNESGKSTLMEFIRGVLFGWPRDGNTYPPLRGGNHGGRVGIVLRDGRRFTIERFGRVVTLWEEGERPERVEPSQMLFPGINREAYRRLFAVGLEEMQGLDILSGEEIRGRLLAAFGGLRADTLQRALNTLDSRMSALLAPRAQREINRRLAQVRELDALCAKLRGQSTEYAQTRNTQEEAEKRAIEARKELARIDGRLRRIEQLEQAREPWVELGQVQERVARLESARAFPAEGWQRLQTLESSIANLKEQLDEAEAEAQRLREKLASIRVDEAVLEQAARIEALHRSAEHIASALKDLPDVQAQLSAAEEALAQRLRALGPDWDADRLEQVDTSLQVRHRLHDFVRELELARQEVDGARADLRMAKQMMSETERERDEARQRLAESRPPRIADRELLGQKREILSRLRVRLHDRGMARVALDEKRQRNMDTVYRLEELKQQREYAMRRLPLWIPVMLGLVVVLGALALAVNGWYGWAGVVLGAGLLSLFPFFWLFRVQGQAAQAVRAQEERLREYGETLTREVKEIEDQLSILEEDVSQLAGQLGLESPVSAEDVERVAHELAVAAEELSGWVDLENALATAERKCKLASERIGEMDERLRQAEDRLNAVQTCWQDWLASQGFASGLTPAGVEVLLQAVEAARETKRMVEALRERVAKMTGYLSKEQDSINSVLAACGRKVLAEPGVEEIAELHEALQMARDARRDRQEVAERLSEIEYKIGQLRRQVALKERELQALFTEAGVRDRGEFCQLREQSEELRDSEKKAEECILKLRTIAGSAEAVEDLVAELSATDAAQVATEKDFLLARRGEVEKEFETAVRQAEGARRRLEELATDHRLSEALLKREALKEEIRQLVRQWAVYVVCRSLIGEARRVYEQERQPQVIKEAESLLKTIVAGRYSLMYSFDQGIVRLQEAETLTIKEEKEWSRGLAEQVYLAVRLGVARELGRSAEALPVMLDDVLVNFDPDRRLGAARVILEFARQHQVLLFSCHPSLLECLEMAAREMDIDPSLIPLYVVEDGKLRRQVWPE